MALSKTNELKTGVSRCDCCSKPAVVISPSGQAFCAEHHRHLKAAEPALPALKNVAERLASQYD